MAMIKVAKVAMSYKPIFLLGSSTPFVAAAVVVVVLAIFRPSFLKLLQNWTKTNLFAELQLRNLQFSKLDTYFSRLVFWDLEEKR